MPKGLAKNNGGKVMAKIQRENAISKYYLNPKLCKNCHKVIEVGPDQKVHDIRKRVFCSLSCNAVYHNTGKVKKHLEKKVCIKCNNVFTATRDETGYFSKSKRCPTCMDSSIMDTRTKKQIFEICSSWQSARSAIRKHASKIYARNNRPKCCAVCGYQKHYDISHLTSVSDFSEDSLITEINDINNLIALCPTHHWEYDHNVLDKPISNYINLAGEGVAPSIA